MMDLLNGKVVVDALVVEVEVAKGPVWVRANVVKMTAAETPRKTTVPMPTPIRTLVIVVLVGRAMRSEHRRKAVHLQSS